MTILQSLDGYYDRMAARGDVTPPGWSSEPVGVAIVIGSDGSVVRVFERLDDKGKRGLPLRVPKWFGRSGQGSTPFLFWDNSAYALGVSTKDPGKTGRDHEAFKALHFRVLDQATDPALLALRLFLEQWTPQQFVPPHFHERMTAFNIAFQFDGSDREYLHDRPAAIEICDRIRAEAGASVTAFCLVRGRRLPVVRLHPKIKGVDGTAASEVPLVSFNEPAFTSYRKEQGYNAPTSEEAATRYAAALTALLDKSASRNRLVRGIGDSTVVFWADTSEAVDEAAAQAAEHGFAVFAEPPDDAGEAKKVRAALEDVMNGRPVEAVDPGLVAGTRFHVLGLSPNIGRLSVRFWLTDTFAEFARRLARHYWSLRIEPAPRGWKLPSINFILARTTALSGDFDNIPDRLAGEVTRSILSGDPYPRMLLTATLARLRAGDDPTSGWHAAVIKACINTNLFEQEIPMALDPDNPSPAYQLGRLFAVLESAQFVALKQVNAPIGDRYYAAASATPARVFGTLLRGLKNHISDARKRGQGGWIEPKVAEIVSHLPPDLPKTLRLEDQGRFAVGYYHEKNLRYAKASGAEPETDEKDEGAEE